jgi:protein-tyrosine phosphatase
MAVGEFSVVLKPECPIHDAMIDLPGATVRTGAGNFRDLGGLVADDGRRLRPSVLLRSDRLCDVGPTGWEALTQLELAAICDLRSIAERERHPNSVPGTLRVQVLEFDVHNDLRADQFLVDQLSQNPTLEGAAEVMIRIYGRFPGEFILPLRRICNHLLSGGVPMLIHCTAGKDRTGFVIAVLLHVLGIKPEHIEADYLASGGTKRSDHLRAALARRLASRVQPSAMDAVLDTVLDAHPTYLRASFAALNRQFGSLELYVRDEIGISDTQRGQLRCSLLYQ